MESARKERQVKQPKSSNHHGGVRPEDEALWKALRDTRLRLARAQGVPPYVIFHDATLLEMMAQRPRNLHEFAAISGVGARKLEQYGQVFLEVLNAHVADANVPVPVEKTSTQVSETDDEELPTTTGVTLALLRQGMTPEEIAASRQLKPSTIYGHLAAAIEAGLLSLEEATALPEEEIKAIQAAIHVLPPEQKQALKPIFDQFEGNYSYDLLCCVRADLRARGLM
jgi:ATP-dependent DNA helicase RecQ